MLFKSSDSLEKQKARTKLRRIQNFFGSSIPMKRTIRRFTEPNGLTGIIITPEATIGDNVRIDANCCVTMDVPANSHVINGSSCIIQNENLQDNSYLSPQQWMEKNFSIGQLSDSSSKGRVFAMH